MVEAHDVVVVGGGQAGLAMSWHLHRRGLEHVVLERARIAERWRTERWDSLAFQFPNWMRTLPGVPFDGTDPDGFALHTDVLAQLEAYAEQIDAPVREQTEVRSVSRVGDRWRLSTPDGDLEARAVVLATGPYQRAVVPALATGLPDDVCQVHSRDYLSPSALPPGGVLVVGSGGSGAQIADELLGAGRTVHLAVSGHQRIPRRYRERDVMWWMAETGFLDLTRADLAGGRPPPTRLFSGVEGGRDLDVRELGRRGAVLCGRLLAVDGDRLRFSQDVEELLAEADRAYADFIAKADSHVVKHRLDLPAQRVDLVPGPRVEPVPEVSLRDSGITCVVWCTGYGLDFSWVQAPFLDERGVPVQDRGVTRVPGLYVLGLFWMHTLKSSILFGVGEDADHLADHLAGYLAARSR
jgi:putative flavoprotein involved in K+ transport